MFFQLLYHFICKKRNLNYIFFSYHIKYMFVGDTMKNDVEGIIRRLRPALQMRLRFIAHISIDEINEQKESVQQQPQPH